MTTTFSPLTATVLVQFDDASASDYSMSASLDDRDTGLNAGRTQFDSRAITLAEWPAFLVWAALGSKGSVNINAHGGSVVEIAITPSIVTTHDQTVTQHVPAGQTSTSISLPTPSIGMPSFSGNATVGGSKSTTDGFVTSVTLALSAASPAPYGSWIVGQLSWSSRARAYRIQPTVGADQAILLAVGLPAEA